jgi:hypothetical protein
LVSQFVTGLRIRSTVKEAAFRLICPAASPMPLMQVGMKIFQEDVVSDV